MTNYVDIIHTPGWYEALDWAKQHCRSYITNEGFRKEEDIYYVRFYFSDEKDQIWFTLRWT
jgi:hypothetical protein